MKVIAVDGAQVAVEGAPRSALWTAEAFALGGHFGQGSRTWIFPVERVAEVEALVAKHRFLCPCHAKPIPYPGSPCRV